jgi:iron transport multicopper oxidase
VDHSITLALKMDNLNDGANYAFFNDITYVSPKVPTLYSVLSTGPNATNPVIYGSNTNSFILKTNEVVEIVLNNVDPGKHPFHLHGHAFQVVTRSEDDAGFYNSSNVTTLPSTPMKRDTILVRPNGHIVLRFRADNPGVWLFHCHIEWHVASGLTATMIERPLDIQQQLSGKIPADHLKVCEAGKVPTKGNAAGNTVDLLDLTGENKSPGTLPAGFTARGIVALVFSCLAAFLGMGVIGWYGMRPIKAKTG